MLAGDPRGESLAPAATSTLGSNEIRQADLKSKIIDIKKMRPVRAVQSKAVGGIQKERVQRPVDLRRPAQPSKISRNLVSSLPSVQSPECSDAQLVLVRWFRQNIRAARHPKVPFA